MNAYERAAEKTIQQAAYHQQMAAELAKDEYASQQIERENKAKTGTNPDSSKL